MNRNTFSQTVERSFEGIPWSDKRPPDPEMAVGPNHVVLVVNSKIAVYSKDGVQISNNNLSTFFNSVTPPGDPFDPRVVYDHLSSRWVVYALSRSTDFATSNYLIAVSQNNDPTSQWYYYKFDARLDNQTNTSNWADYTGLGYNQEAVYITSNQKYIYGTQDFQYAKIRAIKKSDLYSGVSAPEYKDFTNMVDVQGGTKKSENIQPVHQFGTASKFYLMNTANDVTANYVVVWSITNPFGANPVITREANINVGQYNPPLPVVQKNSANTLEPNDAKISDCVFRNGFLYGCFTIRNSTSNGNAIKYIKINATNFSLVINDVIEASNIYYFYPEIYPDLNDNLVLVFNKASSNDYAGVAWTYRYSNASAIGGISWLKEGEAAYYNLLNNRNRWGDYSGICLDPTDNRKVWVYGEYAKTSTTWGTWVGMVNMTLNIPIQFSNLVSTQNAGGSLTVNSSTSVTSGQSLSVLQGDNSVKTNNERFANWNSSGLTYKHNNWNNANAEKFLSHGFTANPGSGQQQNALFRDMRYAKVELKLDDVPTTGSGTLEFQDPWYVLSSGSQPGNYWLSFTSYYEPTGKEGASEKGVFLEQPFVTGQPYYSVRAQATQTIGGYNAYFQNWSTTNATVQSSTAVETPVVFNNANAVVTANYKGHLISNATTGFSSNTQRKVVRTDDGKLHLVYESMNQVWYTYSTDGGSTWLQEQKVDYLGANCKSASIAQSNDGLNKVYVVYQRDAVAADNYPKIILTEFQNGSRTLYADVYTLTSYSYDSKPVTAALNNTVCVVFKPSSTSALRDKNFYYSGSWSAHSDFQVNNTTSNSSNPSIASDVQKYFLAYQNGTTEIKYLEFIRGVDDVFFAYEESIITTGSPYTNNIEPSISSHEGDPLISWSGYSSGIPAAIVKRRVGGTWSNFSSFGSGTVRNTNSSSRDAGTDGSIIAWCNIYNEHKCVKLVNGTYSSITTIPETGGNGQIQLSNGYDFNNIKSVVLKQPSSGIYEVKPLPFNFSTLQKENGNVLRYYGRMAINRKQEKTFVYYLGNILLDGKSIMFKPFQDTANIKTNDDMTEITATENIYLRPNSSLQLSTSYYVIDRDNTKKLVNGDEIKFSVELVDANSKDVKTSFDEAKYDSKNSPEKKSSYTLNLKNIKEGNYFLRISTKTSGGGEFYYCDVQDEETSNLKKEEQIGLKLDNNKIPTGYELLQNYPNPFNPTTSINYQLPENGFVTIKVYDMLGKEVAVLVNENKSAGYYKVDFNASKLTSGVYVYTITANNFVLSKKMLLMK